jgi:hypothetical protein
MKSWRLREPTGTEWKPDPTHSLGAGLVSAASPAVSRRCCTRRCSGDGSAQRSSPCPRRCSPPAAPDFFAFAYTTLVFPVRSCSVPGCGPCADGTDTSRRPTSPGPLRLELAGTDCRFHRDPGDDALHRAPADRAQDRDCLDGHLRRLADHHRVRGPGRLHLPERAARAGADRDRQGPRDLHHGAGRDRRSR